ncbi:hypothetical protein pb186bvf_019111 [Paramecium bursaria]
MCDLRIFNQKFLNQMLDYRLRQNSDLWQTFRNLLILFEGCEAWIRNIQTCNYYRIQDLLKYPFRLINLVNNYKINIQKFNPKNVDYVQKNIVEADNSIIMYLNQMIYFFIQEYDQLVKEEQFCAQLLTESNEEPESRQKTLESQESSRKSSSISSVRKSLKNYSSQRTQSHSSIHSQSDLLHKHKNTESQESNKRVREGRKVDSLTVTFIEQEKKCQLKGQSYNQCIFKQQMNILMIYIYLVLFKVIKLYTQSSLQSIFQLLVLLFVISCLLMLLLLFNLDDHINFQKISKNLKISIYANNQLVKGYLSRQVNLIKLDSVNELSVYHHQRCKEYLEYQDGQLIIIFIIFILNMKVNQFIIYKYHQQPQLNHLICQIKYHITHECFKVVNSISYRNLFLS